MRVLATALYCLLSCGLGLSVGHAKTINSLGNQFIIYDGSGMNGWSTNTSFAPNAPPTTQFLPGHVFRGPVSLYQLNPSEVIAELQAMRASGQTDLAVPIYTANLGPCMFTSCADGYGDAVWGSYMDYSTGALSAQEQSNLVNLLNQAKSLGFKRIIVRFGNNWVYSATTWDPATYGKLWGIISSTRNLVETTLAGSTVQTLYDLGGEQAAQVAGVNEQYVKQLWADYTAHWGNQKTVGFSFAWAPEALPNEFATQLQWYGAVVPQIWGFDIYPDNSHTMLSRLQEISSAMGPLNGQPIVIMETYANEPSNATDIANALNGAGAIGNLNIDALEQWPVIKARLLANLDVNYSRDAILAQSSSSQMSAYTSLLGNHRANLTSSNAQYLALNDSNCGNFSGSSCAVVATYGPPAGQYVVVTVSVDGGAESAMSCAPNAGIPNNTQSIPWIVPGHSYVFKARLNSNCNTPTSNPVAISSVTVN